MYSPRELAMKSLDLHRLVVQKIRANPLLFSRDRDTLERMASEGNGATRPYVAQWFALFDQGLEVVFAVAVEDTTPNEDRRSGPVPRLLASWMSACALNFSRCGRQDVRTIRRSPGRLVAMISSRALLHLARFFHCLA